MRPEALLKTIADGLIDFAPVIAPAVRSFFEKNGPELADLIRPHMTEAPPEAGNAAIDADIDDLIEHGEL
jgi:hypothetical protein